ncbi:MAG: hypothetical protein GTO55_10115 [Armatimonadetes bacterium]|nr:hypothetical protein [Armatimonadota bacterium]NIM24595.1 hypothetical protein [Armatimonadota bacterium]NIM68471.1 hypothetical protein [Armatimonadota bacterium]NIM76857.1 hypothetical protein [Armatimonadota bacterium]NIN06668.1 hypothetical protein [Armatimonadota bacterium]
MGIIRDNPILWREGVPAPLRNSTLRGQAIIAGVFAAVYIGGNLLLMNLKADDISILLPVVLSIWALVTLLIVPSHTARAIAQERVQGTWDAVVLTCLSPAEIIFGKLFSALLPMWGIGLLLLPTCLVCAAKGVLFDADPEMQLSLLVFVYGAAVVASISVASVGIFFSLVCSSFLAALLWTYLVLLAYLSIPVSIIIFFGLYEVLGLWGLWIVMVVCAGAGAVVLLFNVFGFNFLERRKRG